MSDTDLANRIAARHLTATGAAEVLTKDLQTTAQGVLNRLARAFESQDLAVDAIYMTFDSSGHVVVGANLQPYEYSRWQTEKDLARVASKLVGVRVAMTPVTGKKGWWWFRAVGPSFGIVEG